MQLIAAAAVSVGRGAGECGGRAVAVRVKSVTGRGRAVEEAGQPVVGVIAVSLIGQACLGQAGDFACIVIGDGLHIGGGAVEPQRKDLSKEKLLMFMKTPAAQLYGLDNIEVMTEVLSYPETKEKIVTLINAIDRGHLPADGPQVMAETRAIKSWLDAKKTNLPALEQTPEKPAAPVSLFEEEEEEPK